MKITKTKISKIESTIHLVLEKKDYINQYESKLKELKKRANLKGFRPGMVPIQLLKKMYGKGVLFEELNKIVSNKTKKYKKIIENLYELYFKNKLIVPTKWMAETYKNNKVEKKQIIIDYISGMTDRYILKINNKL